MKKLISIVCLISFSLVSFYGYGQGELVCKPVSDPSKCGYVIEVISGCDFSDCGAVEPDAMDDCYASGEMVVVVVNCGEQSGREVEAEAYCASCAGDNLNVVDCGAIAERMKCRSCTIKESRFEPLLSNEIRIYEVKLASRTITGFATLESQLNKSYIFRASRPFGIHQSISSTVLIC